MAHIRNLSLLKKFTDLFKLKVGDMLDGEVTPLIVPVVNLPVYDKEIQVRRAARNTTGSATILTADGIKRTFITGIYMSYTADVSADSVSYIINLTPKGKASLIVMELRKETLTAQDDHVFFPLDLPIEIEPGSVVTVSETFAVGATTVTGIVYFFEEEAF